jgi:hypothetical protein
VDTRRRSHHTAGSRSSVDRDVPSLDASFDPLTEFLSEIDRDEQGEGVPSAGVDQPAQESPAGRAAAVSLEPVDHQTSYRRASATTRFLYGSIAMAAGVAVGLYLGFGKTPGRSARSSESQTVMRQEPGPAHEAPIGATTRARETGVKERPVGDALTAPATASLAATDLSGWWHLTNEVETSSYPAYEGLRLGFQLRLQQDGGRIRGEGHKVTENGRRIPLEGRTPIHVVGVVDDRRVSLTFFERGRRRTSGGILDLELTAEGTLHGRFDTDAATSRGSSVARRASGPSAAPISVSSSERTAH